MPIIAALSDRLRLLYRHVGVPIERLVTVPRGGVIYAQVTRARGVVSVYGRGRRLTRGAVLLLFYTWHATL